MRFLRSYEGQIKGFLTLLVIFIAAAIAVSFHLLMMSRNAIFEEVRLRISTVAEAVRSDLGIRALPLPRGDEAILNSAFNQPRFSQVARGRDLVSLELLDPEGRVLVSSMVGRLGARDSVFTALGGAERRRLELGTTVLTPLREGEGIADATMIGLLPLKDGGGKLSGMLRVEDHAESLARVDRSLRILSAIQAGGLASLMVLVFLFARWLLAPYRILAATAIQAVPAAEKSDRSPEPDFLVASFRTVLEKLRAQEHELQGLRAGRSLSAGEDLPAESLAASLTSGMIAFDRELRVRLVNPAAVRILGKSRAELEGRPLHEVFPEGEGMERLIREARDAGSARSREMVPFVRPDGREIHLGVGLSPIRREGREIRGVICLLSDLTEIRQLQDRVALKENLAHLGEMSAGIAHEFRNSLATISGYARLLGRRDEAEVREMASSISREVRGIGKVVDNFLQFARPVTLSVTEVDLRSLLEDLSREGSLPGESPPCRVVLEGEFPRLRADETLLRQAFQNLLRNAAQARDGEGVEVTITGEVESGETLRLEVSDDGAGIPPEDLPRIFTPFFTTRPDGTGLGLPLVQKAIVSHDGTIDVASQMGVGTRFRIRLPLGGPPADHRAA